MSELVDVNLKMPDGLPKAFVEEVNSLGGSDGKARVTVDVAKLAKGYTDDDVVKKANDIFNGFFAKWRKRNKDKLLNQIVAERVPSVAEEFKRKTTGDVTHALAPLDPEQRQRLISENKELQQRFGVEPDRKDYESDVEHDIAYADWANRQRKFPYVEPEFRQVSAQKVKEYLYGSYNFADPDLDDDTKLNTVINNRVSEGLRQRNELAISQSRKNKQLAQDLKSVEDATSLESEGNLVALTTALNQLDRGYDPYYGVGTPIVKTMAASLEAERRSQESYPQYHQDYFQERQRIEGEIEAMKKGRLESRGRAEKSLGVSEEATEEEKTQQAVARLRKPINEITVDDINFLVSSNIDPNQVLKERGVSVPAWAVGEINRAIEDRRGTLISHQRVMEEADRLKLDAFSQAADIITPITDDISKATGLGIGLPKIEMLTKTAKTLDLTPQGAIDFQNFFTEFGNKGTDTAKDTARRVISDRLGVQDGEVDDGMVYGLQEDLRNLTATEWIEKYPELAKQYGAQDRTSHWSSGFFTDVEQLVAPGKDWSAERKMDIFLDSFSKFDPFEEEEKLWRQVVDERAQGNVFSNAWRDIGDMWVGLFEIGAQPIKDLITTPLGITDDDTASFQLLKELYLDHVQKEYGEIRGLYGDEERALRRESRNRSLKTLLSGVVKQYERLFTEFDEMFHTSPVGTVATVIDVLGVTRALLSKGAKLGGPGAERLARAAEALDEMVQKGRRGVSNVMLVAPAAKWALSYPAKQIQNLFKKPAPVIEDIAGAVDLADAAQQSAVIFSQRYNDAATKISEGLENPEAAQQRVALQDTSEVLSAVDKTVADIAGSDLTPHERQLRVHKQAYDVAIAGIPPQDAQLIARAVLGQMLDAIDPSLNKYAESVPLEKADSVLRSVLDDDFDAFTRYVPEEDLPKVHRIMGKSGIPAEAPDPVVASFVYEGVKGVPEGTRVRNIVFVDEDGTKRKESFGEAVNTTLSTEAIAPAIERVFREGDPQGVWTEPITKDGVTKPALVWEIERIQSLMDEGAEFPAPVLVVDEKTGSLIVPETSPLDRKKLRKEFPGFTIGKGSITNAATLAALVLSAPRGADIPVVVPKKQLDTVRGAGGATRAGGAAGVIDPITGHPLTGKGVQRRISKLRKDLRGASQTVARLKREEIKQRRKIEADKQKAREASKGERPRKKGKAKSILPQKRRLAAAEERVQALESQIKQLEDTIHTSGPKKGQVKETSQTFMTLREAQAKLDEATRIVEEFESKTLEPARKALAAHYARYSQYRMTKRDVKGEAPYLREMQLKEDVKQAKRQLDKLREETGINEYARVVDSLQSPGRSRTDFVSAVATEDPIISREGNLYPESRAKLMGAIGESSPRVPSLAGTPKLKVSLSEGMDPREYRRRQKLLDEEEVKVLTEAQVLSERMGRGFQAADIPKSLEYTDTFERIRKDRQAVEIARIVNRELDKAGEVFLRTGDDPTVIGETNMPAVVPLDAATTEMAISSLTPEQQKVARNMDYQTPTKEQLEMLGLADDAQVQVAGYVLLGLDQLDSLNKASTKYFGLMRSISSQWKRSKVLRGTSFFVNIVSNMILRGLTDNKWAVTESMKEARQNIVDYKQRNITDPELLARMEEYERLGLLTGIDQDIRLQVQTPGERAQARVATEVIESKFSGIDPTTMTKAQIEKRMREIWDESLFGVFDPRTALRMWNKAFNELEKKYVSTDPVFKLEAAELSRLKHQQLLDELSPGESVTFPITETQDITVSKGADGALSTNTGMSVEQALLKRGVLSANRKYFDYRNMPFYHQYAGRKLGLDAWLTPFNAFTYNAKWFPLFKRGLMREVLGSGMDYTTTDPRLRGQLIKEVAKNTMVRNLMRTSGQVQGIQSETSVDGILENIKRWASTEPVWDILGSVGPDEMNVLNFTSFQIADSDRPLFDAIGQLTSGPTPSPLINRDVESMIFDTDNKGNDILPVLSRMPVRSGEGEYKAPTDLKSIQAVTDVTKADKRNAIEYVMAATKGDAKKLDRLKTIMKKVNGNAPGQASVIYNLMQALTGVSLGFSPVNEYIAPIIEMIAKQDLTKEGLRASAEIILGSTTVATVVTNAIMEKDWGSVANALRTRKIKAKDLKRNLIARKTEWRDNVFNDLDLQTADFKVLVEKHKDTASKAGMSGYDYRRMKQRMQRLQMVIERRPRDQQSRDQLALVEDAVEAFETLREKRLEKLLASAGVHMQMVANTEALEDELRKLGVLKQKLMPEERYKAEEIPSTPVLRLPYRGEWR